MSMTRVQLAPNGDDIAGATQIDTPLKLVLIENRGAGERLNHLGIEATSEAKRRSAHRPPVFGLPVMPWDQSCGRDPQTKSGRALLAEVGDIMNGSRKLELIGCPECAAPAEIVDRFDLPSNDGPVTHVKIQCLHRHWFVMTGEEPARWDRRAA